MHSPPPWVPISLTVLVSLARWEGPTGRDSGPPGSYQSGWADGGQDQLCTLQGATKRGLLGTEPRGPWLGWGTQDNWLSAPGHTQER